MKKWILMLLILASAGMLYAQANIETSLHYTREGKEDAYKAENGGMELITGIPMDDLTCKNCHATSGTYPNGDPIDPATYEPSCKDCHDFAGMGSTVTEETCINCHNRQKYERAAYPDVDVHKASGMVCIDCHSKEEIHGDDGVAYVSLKQPGAIKVECEDCHADLTSNTAHDLHAATVDCAACHAQAVLTCASCHFESVVESGKNRAINQLKNYKLLVKKEGEVRLGAFMTHAYDGKTNYIISSYHSHAIAKDATACGDCHQTMGAGNPAITEYNDSGTITMTKWNPDTKKMAGPSGVVPIPEDWKTSLKFDFATYTGDPTVFPSDPTLWEYLKSDVDNAHMYFAEPLDSAVLAALGFTRFPVTSVEEGETLPTEFTLKQNYPNPFNPTTTIEYSVANTGFVSLKVYDSIGKEIATLYSGEQSTGTYKANFDAENLSSGIYFATLKAGNFVSTIKMLLVK